MKNDIEKKAEDLSKEARLEAFREVLKEEYGEKYEIRVKKAETFIFKKNFSVACILLIAFVAIIAAYWPMRSLYNQKTLIPPMETKSPQSALPKNDIEPKKSDLQNNCLPCPKQPENPAKKKGLKNEKPTKKANSPVGGTQIKTGHGSQRSQPATDKQQTSKAQEESPDNLAQPKRESKQPSDTNQQTETTETDRTN